MSTLHSMTVLSYLFRLLLIIFHRDLLTYIRYLDQWCNRELFNRGGGERRGVLAENHDWKMFIKTPADRIL